ncbi:SPFH domain-containing protein [Bacillus halotolerans]|uniref:SPFH domain-containing protein n=1 Tax=Bacillus halotolerans TaxID=260554 RepID=UPI003F7B7739
MSFFRNQLANVVEWEEFRDDMIFYKWNNREIKKGSRLIIRPGQDAVFLNNGRVEGVFQDDGDYDIESEIIPFLSTLKGFKFGFNSGMRAEVLFVNTKEFTVRWGTKQAINIPAVGMPGGMPGGMPIRANGTFNFKVQDYISLIDKIAGVKDQYFVEDIKTRITSILDQLLMKWITREGKDMFNLQVNAFDIAKGIQEDLDMQLIGDGMTVTGFQIMSFNYPQEVQDMITKNASYGMVGDVNRYQQISMTDGMASGKMSGGGAASDMAGMMMGMNMANQMMNQMNQNQQVQSSDSQSSGNGSKPNFCPNCGTKTGEANFCPNCGQKLV